ncbi:MAG: SDR family NAD(P)-dependent oxidoreductase [Gemmatimonadetes bacterium]|nr:SDR family NAD(P)-dependent oxidoreductase [Gemmatimonadota bacterium]
MKTIAITGANRGVGHAAACHLASQGHRIVLVCRDEGRGREALDALADLPGDARHHLVTADLASLDSVRAGARAILELDTPVDALINNAATVPGERMLSQDGFEMQLAVTHLAHFVLTNLLLPALQRAPVPSRVVTVSSGAHGGPAFDFDDPNFERRPYRTTVAYQQSKLANVLFTGALARRTAGSGVQPLALHPGVYDTGLLRDYVSKLPGGRFLARVVGGRTERAGPILADLAVGRRDEDLGGAYFNKGSRQSPSAAARDEAAQERLWAWSAEATGLDV